MVYSFDEEVSFLEMNMDLILELAGNKDLKQKFIADPRAVLAERGISVPEGLTLKVLEDTSDLQHIVLPHLSNAEAEKHAAERLEKRISKAGYAVVAISACYATLAAL